MVRSAADRRRCMIYTDPRAHTTFVGTPFTCPDRFNLAGILVFLLCLYSRDGACLHPAQGARSGSSAAFWGSGWRQAPSLLNIRKDICAMGKWYIARTAVQHRFAWLIVLSLLLVFAASLTHALIPAAQAQGRTPGNLFAATAPLPRFEH